MILPNLRVIIPTSVLARLSASHLVIISASRVAAISVTTPIALPTSGQAFLSNISTTHGLGGTTIPLTATKTFEPLLWSNIVVLNVSVPVSPPSGGSNGASSPGVSNGNLTRIEPRDEPLADRGLPSSVDWRSRGGLNWLCSIQDQGGCENCWIFSATALMETMVRIQHGMWSKRSEADLRDQLGVSCGQIGGPDFALDWAANKGGGVADKQCDEYHMDDQPYFPCGDRSGRTLRVPEYDSLGAMQDQKQWLVNVGPISTCFNVYRDFYTWDWSKGPYKYDGTSKLVGGHCILLVGYDDNASCWIMRNSWGPSFGVNGYGNITYGTAEIDGGAKYGITNVNPDPWTRKRHHNGNMYQGGNGATHRNFELVRANPAGGVTQVHRVGETPFTWAEAGHLVKKDHKGSPVTGQYVNGQPVLLGSSFNRDFEALYWGDHGTLNHWYYSESRSGWFYTGSWTEWSEFAGYPGFVQTDDSNFAIVTRNSDGSLYEWERNSKDGSFAFQHVISRFDTILQSGPALVQSNVGLNLDNVNSIGNLYVVAVLNSGHMQLFWRQGRLLANTTWIPSEVFGSGIGNTPPVMVQDYWRTRDETIPGGFQLLIAVNGQVQHWQRVNTNIITNPPQQGGPGPWGHVLTFGKNIKNVWSLIHGSINQSLEAIVEDSQGGLWHWQYTNAGWNQMAKVPGP